jgi:general secretion pathway protein J
MTGGQRGFTLIEMLVAISVAALLVSLVYGAVRVGQRSSNALVTTIEDTEVMHIGWQFLHDAVTRARPVSDPRDTESRTGFLGSTNALEFVADMPAYVGLGGLIRIRLSGVSTDTGEQLLLTRERFDKSLPEPVDEPTEQAVLVEDLDELQIVYFGKKDRKEPPGWHASWDDSNALPNLVGITVIPSRGRAWPVLIAGPLTGTNPLGESEALDDTESSDQPDEVID